MNLRAFSAGLLAWVAALGCDGSAVLSVSVDGAADGGGGGSFDGSATKRDRSNFDAGLTPTIPIGPPPALNAMATLLVPGQVAVVGTHQSGCSNQDPPSGNGDRWCAFYRKGGVLGTTELWVIDMTQVLAGTQVKCDPARPAADPNCRRLTQNLWTGAPNAGPYHPTTHRFDGDTLIFHADGPTGAVDFYEGPIYAWRPEWPAPRRITSNRAIDCTAHPRTDVVVCLENLTGAGTRPVQFDLTAGRFGDGPLPVVARITPFRGANDASQWRYDFSPDGESFAYSTGGRTAQDLETLYVMKTADIPEIARNAASPRKVTVTSGVSRWRISRDGRKWYYLRDFNYDDTGKPSGSLVMSDFPAGGGETMLAAGVGTFQLIGDGGDIDRGLGFVDGMSMGKGPFKIIHDRNNPAAVARVAPSVAHAVVSQDGRLAYYSKAFDPNDGTADGYVANADGSGSCTLTAGLRSDLFGDPFLPGGGLAFWADKIDFFGAGEGWVASPDPAAAGADRACPGRRKFADGMDYWFPAGDEGLVYSDQADDTSATLKYARIAGGRTLGAPVTVQEQINRSYSLLPNFAAAVFSINLGIVGTDGLYAVALPFDITRRPFAGGADGGAGDGGGPRTDAAGTPDAGSTPDAALADGPAPETDGGAGQ